MRSHRFMRPRKLKVILSKLGGPEYPKHSRSRLETITAMSEAKPERVYYAMPEHVMVGRDHLLERSRKARDRLGKIKSG